jgi:hypothetical protein
LNTIGSTEEYGIIPAVQVSLMLQFFQELAMSLKRDAEQSQYDIIKTETALTLSLF